MSDMSNIYMWPRFWKYLCQRKPDYCHACDVLSVLEGHNHTVFGKILPFKLREKRDAISA